MSAKEIPTSRPLRAYAFDPSRGKSLGNLMTVDVPYEELDSGLSGKYLEVIDYDASNDRFYQPVDLNERAILINGGLDPSESDPRFHQQMVYAIASKTIGLFEFALGRKIKWSFNKARQKKRPLRLYPHGMQDANAFYTRELEAVVFGYFPASDSDPVTTLPGQTIFTCLSHDIIAHEVTHALIDGQRSHFMEGSNPDTLAFHEGFADIVALFQHFTFKEVLVDVIKRTGGLIYQTNIAPQVSGNGTSAKILPNLTTANPLVQLAKQFGEAMGQRAALRGALGTPPDSTELEKKFEPHERGAILVAAVFDAFFTVYLRRVRDLLRIGGVTLDPNEFTGGRELSYDLANRLAIEASKTADHFCNICIRSLDYCPPVDITFGDFLRAMITADFDLVSDDPMGYREALIDAFRFRGIRPNGVFSYSEDSLRWCPPETITGQTLTCTGLQFDLFKPLTTQQKTANAVILYKFATSHPAELGLDPSLTTSVQSFHPIHRVGPDGQLRMEAVAEITQKDIVPVDPSDPSLGTMPYYGGVTLIIDLSPEKTGEIRYAIQKSIGSGSDDRLEAQRRFQTGSPMRLGVNPYESRSHDAKDAKQGLSFRMIHKGY